jgi:hypothetical protein
MIINHTQQLKHHYQINMKNKKRNLITVDLSSCKDWKECQKVIDLITSGRVNLNTTQIKAPPSN